MAENTEISWANDTFNPWEGCQKVSPACDACYAEARNARWNGGTAVNWGPGAPRRRTSEANWAKPLKWQREQAAAMGRWKNSIYGVPADRMDGCPSPPPPRFVFCASLADVFDNAVDPQWRRDLFDLIRATPDLTWLMLTKRPSNIPKLFAETITPELRAKYSGIEHLGRSLWPTNAAMGTSIEDRLRLQQNAPALARAAKGLHPAFTFWSCEPLLEDLGQIDSYHLPDWIITGGETDQRPHKARPSHPDWFRSIRDQCTAAGVAYQHKQNGEWVGYSKATPPGTNPREVRHDLGQEPVFKVGKKVGGRLLDGVEHDARPEVRR